MSDIYLNIIILLVAVGIDLIIGEYPGPVHPTVWIGKTVSFAVSLISVVCAKYPPSSI